MQFEGNKIFLIKIDIDYLKYMYENDTNHEIFYDDNDDYINKPHIGLLINNNGMKYVIPLTSAKSKHMSWPNIGDGYFRIYEIIDITNTKIDKYDVIVDITNKEILNALPKDKRNNYKQRILSVLDIRKMFPVIDGTYELIQMDINKAVDDDEKNRITLLNKELTFCRDIKDKIEKRSIKLYEKQLKKGKPLKYQAHYSVLEAAAKTYNKK